MARIVIAGASGLTGLSLVNSLAKAHEVIAVARRNASFDVPPDVKWVSADVGSQGWTDALPTKCDAIFALFQSPDFRDFPAKANDVFRTNVGGLQELLAYGQKSGANRFVFTSTGGLYAPSSKPLTEGMPLTTSGALGYYLTSKRCGELLVESYAGQFSTLIVRPFFIYGAGQSSGMLVPRLIASVKEGKPLGLQGQNGLQINPIHVSDAAMLLAKALDPRASGIVNLAGPETISLRAIGELIGQKLGQPPVFEVNEAAASPIVVADTARMIEWLGQPQVTVADGLSAMISHN